MTITNIMTHELIGNKRITDYITGGHGIVTLKSDVSDIHYTYKFESPKERKDNDDTMFVKVLIDGSDWMYVGLYKNKQFRLTRASRFSLNSAVVRGVYFIMKLMFKPNYSHDKMHLFHEGVCAVCGRRLTHPDSIISGIGPICSGKVI